MLTGKGFYIWKIHYCEGGDNRAIVSRALKAGLSHVLIKCADGPYRYNIYEGRDLLPDLVNALREAGISVWLWQYVYGNNPAGEAMVAVERIQQLNPDGFVVNAEAEYKNRPNQATAYMSALRAGIDNDLPVALSTYRWPSYHPEFPFKQFMQRCDIAMPQVYWLQAHNPRQQLTRTLNEYAQFNRPVIPTGACFSEHNWRPSASEIAEFIQACQDFQLTGCNFWEWSNARSYVPDGWEVIRSTGWANPPATGNESEPDIPDHNWRARVLVGALNVRSGPGLNYPIISRLRAGDLVNISNIGGDIWVEIEPGRWAAHTHGGNRYMELV